MKTFRLTALVVLLVGLMTSLPAASTPPEALEVEILIFSGRPNPVFTITDPAQISEILGAAKALPPAAAGRATAAPAAHALGYRGIAVRNRSKVEPSIGSLLVHRSTVRVTPATTSTSAPGAKSAAPTDDARADTASGLEGRLLALAQSRGALPPAALAHIQAKE